MKDFFKRTVGIFGGTFDPVHNAHVQLVESVLDTNLCDEVWVMPAAESPFKQGQKTVSFEHRLEMASLAFNHLDRVKVSDFEKNLPKPSYTLQTFIKLNEKWPEIRFRLCIGSDNLEKFHNWSDYKKLLELTDLIVAERPGFNRENVRSDVLKKATFTAHRPLSHSSTEVREHLSDKRFPFMVPEKVLDYITENKLYTSQIV